MVREIICQYKRKKHFFIPTLNYELTKKKKKIKINCTLCSYAPIFNTRKTDHRSLFKPYK